MYKKTAVAILRYCNRIFMERIFMEELRKAMRNN
jgi:hypothetical protein